MTHIYTAKMQPATNFIDRTLGTPGMRFRHQPNVLMHCYGCGKRRRAKNLCVQVFADGWRFWCKGGCKRR